MTTATATFPLLANLVLTRLLVSRKALSANTIRISLVPLHCQSLDLAEVEAALTALHEARQVSLKPLALTTAGRSTALAFLGIDQLPARLDWTGLKYRFLVPLALGLPAGGNARTRLKRPGGLAALIVRDCHDLPSSATASLSSTLEALVCKELGFPEETNLEAVRRKVLSRLLGADTTLTMAQLAKQVPAHAARAARPTPDGLRDAVLRRWVQDSNGRQAPSDEGEAAPEFDLDEFAATVLAAAPACPSGWFGDNKLFVSHLHRALRDEPAFAGLDLPAFKARLVEAHQTGLLVLTRADLVEVMDSANVRESEIRDLTSTYHFLLIQRSSP